MLGMKNWPTGCGNGLSSSFEYMAIDRRNGGRIGPLEILKFASAARISLSALNFESNFRILLGVHNIGLFFTPMAAWDFSGFSVTGSMGFKVLSFQGFDPGRI